MNSKLLLFLTGELFAFQASSAEPSHYDRVIRLIESLEVVE